MNTTKKMPCGLSKDGKLTPRSEFVIPHFAAESRVGFLGLKSGKCYTEAAITYIGKEISAKDIVAKLPKPIPDQAVAILDSFLADLAQFKIGNVIRVEYAKDTFSLKLERMAPKLGEHKPLP
jgi:hypothetical protein